VSASAKNPVGHAEAALLRACADRTGLTAALPQAMPSSTTAGRRDRGITPVGTAIGIVLGAANPADAKRLWAHQPAAIGTPASDSTLHRTLTAVDT